MSSIDLTKLEEWASYLEQGGTKGKEMREMFEIALYAIKAVFKLQAEIDLLKEGEL